MILKKIALNSTLVGNLFSLSEPAIVYYSSLNEAFSCFLFLSFISVEGRGNTKSQTCKLILNFYRF